MPWPKAWPGVLHLGHLSTPEGNLLPSCSQWGQCGPGHREPHEDNCYPYAAIPRTSQSDRLLKNQLSLTYYSRHASGKVNSRPDSAPHPTSRSRLAVTKRPSLDSPQAWQLGLLMANWTVSTEDGVGLKACPPSLIHRDWADAQSCSAAVSSTSHFTNHFITGSSKTQTFSPPWELFPGIHSLSLSAHCCLMLLSL